MMEAIWVLPRVSSQRSFQTTVAAAAPAAAATDIDNAFAHHIFLSSVHKCRHFQDIAAAAAATVDAAAAAAVLILNLHNCLPDVTAAWMLCHNTVLGKAQLWTT